MDLHTRVEFVDAIADFADLLLSQHLELRRQFLDCRYRLVVILFHLYFKFCHLRVQLECLLVRLVLYLFQLSLNRTNIAAEIDERLLLLLNLSLLNSGQPSVHILLLPGQAIQLVSFFGHFLDHVVAVCLKNCHALLDLLEVIVLPRRSHLL